MSERECHPNIFQGIELKNPLVSYERRSDHALPAEQSRDSASKFDIKKLRKIEVSGFQGQNLRKLITIYGYFSKFQIFNNIRPGSLHHLQRRCWIKSIIRGLLWVFINF
ncbi:uncharacterized protein VICG_00987 [Vittaforma corneae ATCC 50505]|uniref:Uncharacterized protein n=1 Tax=Vittaforma corneae (strain ATCC 50505) TaxID=993615 RepID=L2GN93_VITCO|nr:uncharacterized protein VICG_00987 [Vittaforma corneae ATCC 50505]ELA41970.1 hypothetical protein VICG_00987 [Vittaforma corneae ATCC 50505]